MVKLVSKTKDFYNFRIKFLSLFNDKFQQLYIIKCNVEANAEWPATIFKIKIMQTTPNYFLTIFHFLTSDFIFNETLKNKKFKLSDFTIL